MSSEVVVSIRIRLARNLKDYPFVCRLSDKAKEEVAQKIVDAFMSVDVNKEFGFSRINMDDISQTDAVSLVERHLISPEFVSNSCGRVLMLSGDCSVSIMINEEDHIRLQVITDGLSLEKAYEIANSLDDLLNEKLGFAFSEKLGYLTQCPTNLGTGMRASVMLHLPALLKTTAVTRIGANLSKLGLTMRGIYGESSQPLCAMFQLSNQVTLGISEKSAIENLKSITAQLVTQELKARNSISSDIEVQDNVSRSLGILKSAKLMNHNEAMELLSNLRFGVSQKMIESLSLNAIDKLITEIQPASVMKLSSEKLSPKERDIKRAEYLRQKLN